MQRAVDGDNIALTQHFLKIFDTSAADVLLNLGLQWLIIEIENGIDIGASNFSDSNSAIGLVGSIEIDVVGANAGGNGDFELLCLLEALSSEVARVEAKQSMWIS